MQDFKNRNKKRHINKRKKLIYSTIFFILTIIVFGGYTFYQVVDTANNSYNDLERSKNKSIKRENKVTVGSDPMSILLLGIENYSSGGENGRADTQIVLTLNPDNKKVTLTTIPRDTRIKINQIQQYNGFHKINSAYTFGSITNYGAAKLAVESVESLLDIPIDKYISVDFEGFRDLVDAFGGVSINVKEPFWEENIYNNNNKIYFEQGEAHLNGEEALAFVRMRKRATNNSYPRQERQRQFIKAAIDQTVSFESIFKVEEISDIIGRNLETNLKPKELYDLQRDYASMNKADIETMEIQGKNQLINGLYYFIPNPTSLNEISKYLKRELQTDKSNS